MKIIILGAGSVGSTLAANLTSEANDITLIDVDAKKLQNLQDRLDIRTVVGPASHPDVLRAAGAEDADIHTWRALILNFGDASNGPWTWSMCSWVMM